MATQTNKVVITNVRIFDGDRICELGSVIIDGGLISTDPLGAREIDGKGGILLPGFIDAHIHVHGEESLQQLCAFGITTGLDMGCWPPTLVQSLRERKGLTDIRSPGAPAIAPGSRHSHIPGIPETSLVTDIVSAAAYVASRVAEGSDYIKIVSDTPGFDQTTLNAIAAAARSHSKLSIAHAVNYEAFSIAQDANVDILTHVPLDKALDKAAIESMLNGHRIAVPTLTMMKGIAANGRIPWAVYQNAKDSVGALYHAGVPILAGTDSNAQPGVPANVRHGESLHEELELLVEAGLSNLDALKAATSMPAKYFGLHDRGIIKPGRRADLVLLKGNPLENIQQTRTIQRVWCRGIEVNLR